MNIDIFGLGYVGSVLTSCLASKGNTIYGFDIDSEKISKMKKGLAPVSEEFLSDLMNENINSINVSNDFLKNGGKSNIGFICVGTPYKEETGLDFQYVYRVIDSICLFFSDSKLSKNKKPYIIAIRSTATSNFVEELENYVESKYQLISKKLITICLFPEFLREGSAIKDFFSEDVLSVFSCFRDKEYIEEILSKLFFWNKPIFSDMDSCSQIKLISNSWHALKVAFTNEVSQILRKNQIDSKAVFELFSKDKVLNISSAYMSPGFSFGGSCLTKDLSGLIALGDKLGLDSPILKSIHTSNNLYIERVSRDILKINKKNVLFLGITFKANTDDLRSSPYLSLAHKLNKFKRIVIYDEIISKQKINQSFSRLNISLLSGLENNVTQNLEDLNSEFFDDLVILLCHFNYVNLIESIDLISNQSQVFNLSNKYFYLKNYSVTRYV